MLSKARTALLIAALAAPAAFALMAGDPAGDPPDSPALRIDPNTTLSPWAGVGSVVHGNGAFSGVLIASNYVLTAAHVVAGTNPKNVAFVLNYGQDASQRLAADQIFVHPAFGKSDTNGGVMEADLAVIRLKENAAFGVPSYRLLAAPLPLGALIAMVGYGGSGTGDVGASISGSPTVKRVGVNRIDRFLFSRANPNQRIGFLYDFDGPTLASNAIGDAIAANGTLGNRIETTVASGDSGSPVFVQIRNRTGHNQWIVAGINTFAATVPKTAFGSYGSSGGGMLVSAYLPWIQSVAPGGARDRRTLEERAKARHP